MLSLIRFASLVNSVLFLFSLFALADKYGADLAMNALTANLRLQTVEFPLYTFALAAAYDRVDVQVEALQQFDRSPNPATKPFWLNLIPMELRSKIPLRTMWKVLELHEAVEDREEGTWAELALKMDWKVSSPCAPFVLQLFLMLSNLPFPFPGRLLRRHSTRGAVVTTFRKVPDQWIAYLMATCFHPCYPLRITCASTHLAISSWAHPASACTVVIRHLLTNEFFLSSCRFVVRTLDLCGLGESQTSYIILPYGLLNAPAQKKQSDIDIRMKKRWS